MSKGATVKAPVSDIDTALALAKEAFGGYSGFSFEVNGGGIVVLLPATFAPGITEMRDISRCLMELRNAITPIGCSLEYCE